MRTVCKLFLVTVLAGISYSAAASTVGYWRFEGATYTGDSSGNGLTLTSQSNAPAQYTLPVSGPGAAFDRLVPQTSLTNTSAINQGAAPMGNFRVADSAIFGTVTSNFTIEAYVNRATNTASSMYIASQFSATGGQRSWSLAVAGNTPPSGRSVGELFLNVSSNGANNTVVGSGLVLQTNVDYYLAASMDFGNAASGIAFCVKNLSTGSSLIMTNAANPLSALWHSTADFRIGAFDNSANRWPGLIDEVRLSNRALPMNELLVAASSNQPPVIDGQPQSQTVSENGNASFAVSVHGTFPLSYQWRSNSVPVIGETNQNLFLSNVTLDGSGSQYTVVITNVHGSITSAPAVLNVISNTYYFVSPSGSDANDGSSGSPWKTLAYACDQVPAGANTIQLATGAFQETTNAFPKPGVSIVGNGRLGTNRTTVKAPVSWNFSKAAGGGTPADNVNPAGCVIRIVNGSPVDANNLISGIEFLNDPPYRAHGAIYVQNARNVRVHDISVLHFGYCGVVAVNSASNEICHSYFRNSGFLLTNGYVGSIIYRFCSRIKIHDNEFLMESGHGEGVTGGGGSGARIYRNVFNTFSEFDLEIPFDHEYGTEIYSNVFSRGVSVPKQSGQADPNSQGYPYSVRIHHNVFSADYCIEGPRTYLEVDHNYFSGTNPRSGIGGVIVFFGGSSPGPIWIHHNLAQNVDNGFFGVYNNRTSETYSNVQILHNTIFLSDNRTVSPAQSFLNTGGARAEGWRVQNNVVVGASTRPTPPSFGGANLIASTINSNVCNYIADVQTGSYQAAPGLTLSGTQPYPYFAPANASSIVVGKGAALPAPYPGADWGLPGDGSAAVPADIGRYSISGGAAENTVPAAPGALVASPTNAQVSLSWTASSGATSYNIKRTDYPGWPYAIIATNVATSNYADTTAINGINYYYVVSAVNSVGEGSNSSEVSATPFIGTIVDNADNTGVVILGAWISSVSTIGYYGSNYLHDSNTGSAGGKSVRFTPTFPVSGVYRVYLRWTANPNRASNASVDVSHAAGTNTVTVDQRLNNGIWVILGEFSFIAGTAGNVLVRNDGANGYVIADAVKFVLVSEPPFPILLTAISAANGNLTINFTAGTSDTPASFKLQSSATVNGSYTDENFGVVTGSAGSFQAVPAVHGESRFYRIRRDP